MLEFFRQNSFLIGALTGSLATYLLSLLIGYMRREKRWLGYSREMRNIVRSGDPHLSIQYDNTLIARLDSHRVIVRNIGNQPLSKLPVRLNCETGVILEWEVHTPDGAEFTNEVNNGNRSLNVLADLLNPGEKFIVGMTVADSVGEEVKVTARAENLIVKEIKEEGTLQSIFELLASTSTSVKIFNLIIKHSKTF